MFLKSGFDEGLGNIVKKVCFFSFNSTGSWKTGPTVHSWVPEGTRPAVEIITLLGHESSIFSFMVSPGDKLLTTLCSGAGCHIDASPASKGDETGTGHTGSLDMGPALLWILCPWTED